MAEKILSAKADLEGERKQVTVMFVDIVRSMDLERQLGSERWRKALDSFFRTAADGVHRFEGTIDKFTGDGIMAIFGAPVSQEDHARRACLAAQAIHSELLPLAHELAQEELDFAVRIGLNSGEVIVGEIGDEGEMAYTAIGHTVGLAQRIESVAPPGSVALSAATASLVAAEFEVAELGEFELKGAATPELVFELVGNARWRDRVEAAGGRGRVSRFVGREAERAALESALDRAGAGEGSVVQIVGEPGVGKSRLADEFLLGCIERNVNVHRARAPSHARRVPLVPVLELWRSMLGVREDDDAQRVRKHIEGTLRVLGICTPEDLPFVFEFLAVHDPERPAPKVDPAGRQRILLRVWRELVRARGRERLETILIEDLHWLDDSSAVFIDELSGAVAGGRIVVILTCRPGYEDQAVREWHGETLALAPLADEAAEDLLANLLGPHPSVDGMAELIARRASGNPFFCEELVSALASSENLVGEPGAYRLARTLEQVVLPATVQATLAARIDRLSERDKRLLQVAAVLGFELSEQLLGEVSGLDESDLGDGLGALLSAEMLTAPESANRRGYAFKHPLTQEVAYRSQLSDRRREIHRGAAIAIERLYPARANELAALVAGHFESAGEELDAADRYMRAAAWVGYTDVAQGREHWRRVASLAERAPESTKANVLLGLAHQGALQTGWRLGMSKEEAAEHYRAARELALRTGDPVALVGTVGYYSLLCGMSGRLREYQELAEEADRLACEVGIPALRMPTSANTTFARWTRGRLADALALAEEMIRFAAGDASLGAGLAIACPLAFCHLVKGMAVNFMGRPDEASLALETARGVARANGDLETEGYANQNFVLVARQTGLMSERELELATNAVENAERTGSDQARVQALALFGLAQLELGDTGAAVAMFEHAVNLALETRTGHELLPLWQAFFADALRAEANPERALEVACDGLQRGRAYGADGALPTCHRAVADALMMCRGAGAAEEANLELDAAMRVAEAAGAFYERPFIERSRAALAPTS